MTAATVSTPSLSPSPSRADADAVPAADVEPVEVFEISNPSDEYTIKGPFTVAAVAVALLGRGAWGIPGSPAFLGWDDWFAGRGIDLQGYIISHRKELVAALDGVLIGSPASRVEVEAALEKVPVEERVTWLADYHERNRTSLNDIGAAAKMWARALEVRGEDDDDEE